MDFDQIEQKVDELFPKQFRPFSIVAAKLGSGFKISKSIPANYIIKCYLDADYSMDQLRIYLTETKEYLHMQEEDQADFVNLSIKRYCNKEQMEQWQERQAYSAIGVIIFELKKQQKVFRLVGKMQLDPTLFIPVSETNILEIILIK